VVTGPDIPGYELLDVLGRGGFGVVYRARQVAIDREVAVKVDNRALTSERDQRRFLREVRAAGQLSAHPNVVNLYDAGTLPDGRPYLVMERCAESLHEVLHREGPMPAEKVRDIGIRLADALAAAHQAGILHRDIKPANILVNDYGVVALSDFGLASILDAEGGQSATIEALTPAFAAPEAFHGLEPTALFDVFSLAATLYCLLSGRPPRLPDAQASIFTILRQHDQPLEPVPGVSEDLQAVLRLALEPDPARRLPTAEALRDGLAGTVPDDRTNRAVPTGVAPAPIGARSRPRPPQQSRPPRRSRRAVLGAFAVLGVLTAATGGYLAAGSLGLLGGGDPATSPTVSGLTAPASAGPGTGPTTATTVPGSPSTAPSSPPRSSSSAPASVPAGTASPGGSASPPAGRGGRTAGCVAAAGHPGAWCPTGPECWGGPVYISGQLSGIRSRPCAGQHVWETFAIATIPAQVDLSNGPDYDAIKASRLASTLCSPQVLDPSRVGPAAKIPLGRWTVDVLPPTPARFEAGVRSFRCIATLTGTDVVGSAFQGTGPFHPTPS
jgi:serine/threonine protein kinase